MNTSDARQEWLDGLSPAAAWEVRATKRVLDELFCFARHYRFSAAYRELLKFVAGFRSYAPYNAMLVRAQMQGAGFVAPAHRWIRQYGRTIKANARPLVILQPMGPVMFVFDVSDTEPGPFAKFHEVPAHHNAESYIDAYLAATGIAGERKTPLFRSLNRRRELTERRISRREVLAMIKRRARKAELPDSICCHTFRATGITAYLLNGGTLEHAQRIAAHESPRTTKLYDRTSDEITLDEIERIII